MITAENSKREREMLQAWALDHPTEEEQRVRGKEEERS